MNSIGIQSYKVDDINFNDDQDKRTCDFKVTFKPCVIEITAEDIVNGINGESGLLMNDDVKEKLTVELDKQIGSIIKEVENENMAKNRGAKR